MESVAANANENREEEEEDEVLVDSWRTAVPMETLGDTRISIFLSLPHQTILANPICPRRYSFISRLTLSILLACNEIGKGMIKTR